MKKTIFRFLIGASLLALVYGCSEQKKVTSSEGINIGVILGFTGPIAVSYTHLTLPTKRIV